MCEGLAQLSRYLWRGFPLGFAAAIRCIAASASALASAL
jgi:hypothetical protein